MGKVIITSIFLGIGLAMDACAVSMANGLKENKMKFSKTLLIAFMFGLFQGAMPLIGYLVGSQVLTKFEWIIPWAALGILGYLGGKMIYESLHDEDECECCENKLNLKELTALAIATSIDALAVGVAFALEYEQNTVFVAVTLIGVITALLSAIGVFIGHKFGAKYKNKAELAGGLVLVLMGVKFLLEGLGVI